jgi:hypothetical protein
MASWYPDRRESLLGDEPEKYLAVIQTLREEIGHDPAYTNEGEWVSEGEAA